MAIKTTYLISCVVLLLANCNIQATCIYSAGDCDESQLGSTGYFASGSAHSSQYVLPSGEVVTHSKGSSFSSDGIKKTFEQLKQEANQFVSKQKDSLSIPNALPPLHSSYGQDLQNLQPFGEIGYPAQTGYLNKLESASASHQHQILSSGASQNAQVYQTLPQTSKVITTKKEHVQLNKKVVSHGSNLYGSAGSGIEEIETNQNGLDSNLNSDSLVYQPVPSYIDNVHAQSGIKQDEIETLNTNAQLRPIAVQKIQSPSQTSYSKYEQRIRQNSSSQVVPVLQTYIPNGQFTTGAIDLNTIISNKIPSRLIIAPAPVPVPVPIPVPAPASGVASEKHYSQNEEKESSYFENVASSLNSDVNTQQQEHKYNAVPVVNAAADVPIKIMFMYDGKTVQKTVIYRSGVVKTVPSTIAEYENAFNTAQQQGISYVPQNYIHQPVSHEKSESDGYYYHQKGQGLTLPSTVQSTKKEQSQSSYSQQQSITNGNVEQFSHLPLNVHSQKQYYTQPGYTGIIPPASSQIKYEGGAQSADTLNLQNLQNENPAILVRGVPQIIPIQSQSSSSSSGSTFHSASYAGSNGGFVFPEDSAASSHTSSDLFEKFSSSNGSGSNLLNCGDCLTGIGASNLPVKNTYGIATSFSSSSSNINGKKTENRHASVSVNDNGKVDTYNVKS